MGKKKKETRFIFHGLNGKESGIVVAQEERRFTTNTSAHFHASLSPFCIVLVVRSYKFDSKLPLPPPLRGDVAEVVLEASYDIRGCVNNALAPL